MPRKPIWNETDVLVFTHGAWVQANQMRSLTHSWLGMLRKLAPRVTLVWMEYYGGHFDTSDGDYAEMRTSGKVSAEGSCVPLRNRTRARESPLVRGGNDAARSLGVPILSVFDLSAGMSGDHSAVARGGGAKLDCRHWCLPGAVLEARNQLLFGLLKGDCLQVSRRG